MSRPIGHGLAGRASGEAQVIASIVRQEVRQAVAALRPEVAAQITRTVTTSAGGGASQTLIWGDDYLQADDEGFDYNLTFLGSLYRQAGVDVGQSPIVNFANATVTQDGGTGVITVTPAGGGAVVLQDTLANIPAAGTAGRLFFATDTGELYIDDGDSWELATPQAIRTSSSPSFAGLTLNLGAAQDYLWLARDPYLAVQAQAAGSAAHLEVFSKDSDGTDETFLVAFRNGTPADDTDAEWLAMGWNPSTSRYEIRVAEKDAGSLRPLAICMADDPALQVGTDRFVAAPIKLGVGATLANSFPGQTKLWVLGDGEAAQIVGQRNESSENGPVLQGRKARGSVASPAAVSSGDILQAMTGYGYQNSDWRLGAGLFIKADGAPSGSIVPGQVQIHTTNAAGTLTLAATFNKAQALVLAGDLYNTPLTDWSASASPTGFSSTSLVSVWYKVIGKMVWVTYLIAGTSNATGFGFTLPVTSATGPLRFESIAYSVNNGVYDGGSGNLIFIDSNSSAAVLYRAGSPTGWTAANGKTAYGDIWYPAA